MYAVPLWDFLLDGPQAGQEISLAVCPARAGWVLAAMAGIERPVRQLYHRLLARPYFTPSIGLPPMVRIRSAWAMLY